jgi:hypothetical protein
MRRITLLAGLVLLSGCGTDVSGPPASLFACVFGEAPALEVGGTVSFDGAGNRSLCLTAPTGDAAFAYIPFFASPPPLSDETGASLSLSMLGAGTATGPWAPAPSPAVADQPGALPLSLGGDVHQRLREREIAELEPMIRSTLPGGSAPAIPTAALPAVGDLMELNVALSCTTERMRTGRVMAVSQRAIIVADLANPGSGFTAADYADLAGSFDTLIHPVATRHFGSPSDIDGNGRIIVFFTRAVNEMTPPGSSTFTAGVFWAGDLFPATATARLEACPAANQAELFYVAVPDPTASAGPQVPLEWLRERVVRVMVHEYQHLLNAARRMYVNATGSFEQTWLNEGLSHIAEELLFFEATGLAPGMNIDVPRLLATPGAATAFTRYMGGNETNLRRYLEQPATASPMASDALSTRGAAWSFLRYAADRSGAGDESVFHGLVNSTRSGLANLDAVLGAPTLDWMRDWAVALYADDHVPGIDRRHTQPSWNFRDLYGATQQGFPLPVASLPDGTARQTTLVPGGATHLAFGVGDAGRVVIHVEADGGTPPRTLRGTFLRIR